MLEREIDGGEQGREVRDGRRKGRNGGARKREEGRGKDKIRTCRMEKVRAKGRKGRLEGWKRGREGRR